jgi:hypothetical protein
MTKTPKTSAEILALVRAELERHVACPADLSIDVVRAGDTWELRTSADHETKTGVGYGECVAKVVQIGDMLSREIELKD